MKELILAGLILIIILVAGCSRLNNSLNTTNKQVSSNRFIGTWTWKWSPSPAGVTNVTFFGNGTMIESGWASGQMETKILSYDIVNSSYIRLIPKNFSTTYASLVKYRFFGNNMLELTFPEFNGVNFTYVG